MGHHDVRLTRRTFFHRAPRSFSSPFSLYIYTLRFDPFSKVAAGTLSSACSQVKPINNCVVIKIWYTRGSRHVALAVRSSRRHPQEKSPSKRSNVQNIPETTLLSWGYSSSQSQFFRVEQDNLCNKLYQIPPIFVEYVTLPGYFIFQTWFTILISTRATAKSSRYHSRNQEHNLICYERSQRVDRAVLNPT